MAASRIRVANTIDKAMKAIADVLRRTWLRTLPLGFLLFSGCATEVSPITGQTRAYGYSWEQEVQIGRETDAQITEQMGIYDDPELQSYVERIGQLVLESSDLRDPDTPAEYRETAFTFRVLNSPVVNAFALPGGYVYLTRGLITHLGNEAQLAVVLGHEVAHVAARHASQQALKAQWGQLGLMAGAIIGQEVLGGAAAENILNIGGSAFQLLLLRYGRDAERESDQLGVAYAARQGYQVGEAAKFFRSLERLSGNERAAIPSWQSTHPDPGERSQTILRMASEWEQKAYTGKVERDAFLEHLDGVPLGEDPREGFVRNQVFYHPQLQFKFPIPQGWKVQNETAVVILADPNGGAVMGFQAAPGNNPREAAAQFVQSSGITVVNSGPTQLNGANAFVVVGQANAQSGPVAVINYFIQYRDRLFSFLGYARADTFARYRPAFETSMRGFAEVTDPAILGVQPARIEIVTADRSAPFQTFVPARLPEGITVRDLAILNQVEVAETIPEGRQLKLPAR